MKRAINVWVDFYYSINDRFIQNTIITENVKRIPSVLLWVVELAIQSILQSIFMTKKYELKNISTIVIYI
jgi:hypothetical protein